MGELLVTRAGERFADARTEQAQILDQLGLVGGPVLLPEVKDHRPPPWFDSLPALARFTVSTVRASILCATRREAHREQGRVVRAQDAEHLVVVRALQLGADLPQPGLELDKFTRGLLVLGLQQAI